MAFVFEVKTYHFGSQVALDSDIKFPAAHEPSSIWKAIWNHSGETPPGFWQEVELDPLAGSVKCISGEDVINQGEIVKAIRECYQPVEFITRARQWAEGISDTSNKAPAIQCIDEVERLGERDLQGITRLTASIKQRLLNTRSDTAGCVYYTLLVSVVLQGLMAGNSDRAAPKNQMHGSGLLKR